MDSRTEDIQRLVSLAKMAETLQERIQRGGSDEAIAHWLETQSYYLRQAERQAVLLNRSPEEG